jgi:glucose/mannose transport system substrate-binding protein
MSPEFQEVFNLNKGSIPVRLNMNMDKFDDCAKLSAKEFVDTAKSGGLVPSVSQDMALKPAQTGALKDVVSQFWNDDKMAPETAMKNMVKAAQTK